MRINTSGQIGVGTTPRNEIIDFKAVGDQSFAIRAGFETNNSILYLCTPVNDTGALKTAIIAQGQSWGRSKLHFCLKNNQAYNNYSTDNTSITDAKMTFNDIQ